MENLEALREGNSQSEPNGHEGRRAYRDERPGSRTRNDSTRRVGMALEL